MPFIYCDHTFEDRFRNAGLAGVPFSEEQMDVIRVVRFSPEDAYGIWLDTECGHDFYAMVAHYARIDADDGHRFFVYRTDMSRAEAGDKWGREIFSTKENAANDARKFKSMDGSLKTMRIGRMESLVNVIAKIEASL